MDITNYVMGMILAFSRVSSFLFMIPFLRTQSIPAIAKITISLGISMSVAGTMGQIKADNLPQYISLVLAQILIGITLAFVVEMVISSVKIAGGLIDIELGYSTVQLLDPTSNQQTTVISNLFYILFTVVFIQVGGINLLISGIVFSFKFTTPEFFLAKATFIKAILSVFGYMFVAAIQIALPYTATMFIVNFVLLVLGKSAPQMNIFQNMYIVKIAIGIIFLYITMPYLGEIFTQLNDGMMEHYTEVMNQMFQK